jgi:hypothetical protein
LERQTHQASADRQRRSHSNTYRGCPNLCRNDPAASCFTVIQVDLSERVTRQQETSKAEAAPGRPTKIRHHLGCGHFVAPPPSQCVDRGGLPHALTAPLVFPCGHRVWFWVCLAPLRRGVTFRGDRRCPILRMSNVLRKGFPAGHGRRSLTCSLSVMRRTTRSGERPARGWPLPSSVLDTVGAIPITLGSDLCRGIGIGSFVES